MLHPVGDLPARVYWRRRLLLGVVPVLLLMLLLWALFGGGGKNHAPTISTSAPSHSTASAQATPGSMSGAAGMTQTAGTTARSGTRPSPANTTIGPCSPQELAIEAATASRSFPQQSHPMLYLQVTNTSAQPCRHDLADQQVLLRIQSGATRIWGSQDCSVLPGKDLVTLRPATPVRRGIVWPGRTSAPGCRGVRLYPQPGTYVLYAQLSGQQSKPVTFTITPPR